MNNKNKLSKTFTFEEDTLKVLEKLMKEKNLSSYSVAFERIVLEWSIIKNNNVNIDDIVKKVLEELSKNNNYTVKHFEEAITEENKHTDIIKNIFDDMPE